MDIIVTKRDILWSYLAKFFNIGVGLITLPAILKLLSAEEVGVNYILLSISSMIVLFDMGFSSQFSRYLTYIFSGAQKIEKEGVASEYSSDINKHLLAVTIKTAKTIYEILSFIALFFLFSAGTLYIYYITDGFQLINNIFLIWALFCLSSFFNMYFLYLNSFLQGRGLVKESNQAQVMSRIVQLILLLVLLLNDCGLLGVVIANLIAPFVFRFLAFKQFYTADLNSLICDIQVTREEVKKTFGIIFYNAKKIGVIAAFAALLGYASTLIIAMFLPLPVVGSYGVLSQIVGVIGTVSMTYIVSKMPQLSNLMVTNNKIALKKEFGFSMFVFYVIFLGGIICLLFVPFLFNLFGFSVTLPAYGIVIFYGITRFVEQNQSAYCQLLIAQNRLLYFKSSILTCVAEFTLLFVCLRFGWGLWGVVIAQAIPLYAYCAWKWPVFVCKEFEINFMKDVICIPYKSLINIMK